jgi:hypothetical protein
LLISSFVLLDFIFSLIFRALCRALDLGQIFPISLWFIYPSTPLISSTDACFMLDLGSSADVSILFSDFVLLSVFALQQSLLVSRFVPLYVQFI